MLEIANKPTYSCSSHRSVPGMRTEQLLHTRILSKTNHTKTQDQRRTHISSTKSHGRHRSTSTPTNQHQTIAGTTCRAVDRGKFRKNTWDRSMQEWDQDLDQDASGFRATKSLPTRIKLFSVHSHFKTRPKTQIINPGGCSAIRDFPYSSEI